MKLDLWETEQTMKMGGPGCCFLYLPPTNVEFCQGKTNNLDLKLMKVPSEKSGWISSLLPVEIQQHTGLSDRNFQEWEIKGHWPMETGRKFKDRKIETGNSVVMAK